MSRLTAEQAAEEAPRSAPGGEAGMTEPPKKKRVLSPEQLARKRERDRRRWYGLPKLPRKQAKPRQAKPQRAIPPRSEKWLRDQVIHAANVKEFEQAIRAVIVRAAKEHTLGRTSAWYGMTPAEIAAEPLPIDDRGWRTVVPGSALAEQSGSAGRTP